MMKKRENTMKNDEQERKPTMNNDEKDRKNNET